MVGIEKARHIIEEGLKADKKILLYGDADIDGIISLKIMCEYFDELGKDYTYYINDNRMHGFLLEPELLSGYLVVSADFAITRDELQHIVECGVSIVSTDHHKVESDFIEYSVGNVQGVVLNNQYPFEPDEDRYNSGAGVIYEVFKELIPEFATTERDAMIGITLLSDARAIENKKARRYLAKLYSTNEGYIEYLLQCTMRNDFGFGCPKMDRSFVDFTFSPTVNAMLRFNKTKVAIDLILGKGLTDYTDYKEKQSVLVKQLYEDAEVLDLKSVYILALDASKYDVDITNFIGLVCMKYKNKGKSALAFAYKEGRVLRASFRGACDGFDYQTPFHKIGVNAQGHDSAFGIPNFYPNADTWKAIAQTVAEVEKGYIETRKIIEASNLSVALFDKGSKIAYENCYVRDMYRTYIKYTGSNVKISKTTYKMEEFDNDDYLQKRKPDKRVNGTSYKYILDENGEKIIKYQEYTIDGKTVKSFGVGVEDGLIMPILEKGYMNLYLV